MIVFVSIFLFVVLMRNYFPDFPSLLRFSGDVISALNKTRGRGGKRDKSCESHFFIVLKKMMTAVIMILLMIMMMRRRKWMMQMVVGDNNTEDADENDAF